MPVTELILWQNVPTGSRVDVSVEPVEQPLTSDGEHTFGATTLEQADDLSLRPGPHSFRRFTQPGSHTIDIRTANQSAQPIAVTVTAALFDADGQSLTDPEVRPRQVPSNDTYLVMLVVKVVGEAPPATLEPTAVKKKAGARKGGPKKAKPRKGGS
ncbi:MAG: hypothetical protein ABJC74_04730 [Gemmatimonadota bacterium]